MAKPWDVPLLPKNGDAIQDKTYAHVGFVMTCWESLEFELSRLHSDKRVAHLERPFYEPSGVGKKRADAFPRTQVDLTTRIAANDRQHLTGEEPAAGERLG